MEITSALEGRMLVEAILFIVVALMIAYIVLNFVSGKATYQGSKPYYDLSVPNQLVLTQTDAAWSTRPCSIRFGIFVESAPRTVSKVDCVEVTNPAFGPSCSDYSFSPCQCASTDCGRCEMKADYMSKLLWVGDRLELWASGYTSQNDKPYVPALLKVRTAQDSNQHMMEAVPLPAIPLQRWTIVTIVKEGRRFDVFYGTNLVASKLLSYVPVSGEGRQWYAGNKAWKGKIGFFAGTSLTAPTAADVKKDVEALVNTRGVPFYMDQVTFSFDTKMPSCILGDCNKLPEVRPPNPFTVYASSVA